MQPGQIPTLTFPGTPQAGTANGPSTASAIGRVMPASSIPFANLLAGLTAGSETALPPAVTPVPAVMNRASEQGLLHANIRSVLGGNPLAAGADLTGSGSSVPVSPFEQNGLEAILLPAGPAPVDTAAPAPLPGTGLSVGAVDATAGNTAVTGATAPAVPGMSAPAAPQISPVPAATTPATEPVAAAPLPAGGTAPATIPASGTDAATLPPSVGTATGTSPSAGQASMTADPVLTGNAELAGDAAELPATPSAKLPVQAATAAHVATADNAKAGMKASVLAKLPTQATPAQVNLPQATSPAPVEGQSPATASPIAGQATAQTIAQAQSLNGAQASAAAASQLPAESQSLKATAGLKDTNETRAILQPRGASALAAGQAGTASQTAAASASATSAAKPDTTAAVPTTTTSGAEPALPVQRELPATAQPAALQPGLAQTAGLETAPLLSGGEEADAAATADLDLQTGRMLDARVAADRSGAHLPRFAAHTTQTLAGQITRQFNQGNRVFEIRLDPAELGKVDVRLEMRADNRVHAVLTAERPDTLLELQRNARELERALNEAGLELGEDGLDFQMQQDDQSAAQNESGQSGPSIPVFTESETASLLSEVRQADAPRSTYGFLLSRREGVDMRV